MAIVQTCNFYAIERAFCAGGRGNNFTPAGLRVLVEYMEEVSDSTGQPVELDVVAWCCEYTEDTVEDIVHNYNLEDEVTDMDEDEKRDFVESYLQENTIICGETGTTIVYRAF